LVGNAVPHYRRNTHPISLGRPLAESDISARIVMADDVIYQLPIGRSESIVQWYRLCYKIGQLDASWSSQISYSFLLSSLISLF
jgi:hypothetical protein